MKLSEQIAQMILDNALAWTRYGGNYTAVQKQITEIVDSVLQSPVTDTCEWVYHENEGTYTTSCGERWFFPESTRQENGAVFCPVCGKRIKERGAK